MKFGTASAVPNFTFIRGKMWEYSPQNCQNFEFWPEICDSGATCLQYFNEIFGICTHLLVAFKFLVWSLSRDKHPNYKHLPAVGAFSLKFSSAPSGETTDRMKKVRRCKNGTDLLYHHAKYGDDRGLRAGCRRKSVMFFFCLFVFLSHFGMKKFVITETL